MAVDPTDGQEDGSQASALRAARIEQARGEFLASFERRASELRASFQGLACDPGSPRQRDELRRRIHAVGAAARLLRFDRLAAELQRSERLLERAAGAGGVDSDDLVEIGATLDSLELLAGPAENTGSGGRARSMELAGSATFLESPLVAPEPAATTTPPAVRPADATEVPRASRSPHAIDGPQPSPAPHARSGIEAATHEEGAESARPAPDSPQARPATVPSTILVIGPLGLVDTCRYVGASLGWSALEIEHAPASEAVTNVARMLGPDLVLLDADVAGARDLVRRWREDPLIEPAPIIVVGRFADAADGAQWIAAGAASVVAKPVSIEALARACAAVLREAPALPHHTELGTLTVQHLAERIADEVRRGLVGAVEPSAQSSVVALGEGVEVLGAVWGALARIREIVTLRSEGAIRFTGGPEGALPVAPLERYAVERRALPDPERGITIAGMLEGRTVVVVDDDPAVTWFVGGVLRQERSIVHEAHDGRRALELCHALGPELVVTDIIMPELDGFAFCRALKRDLVLGDVPVILLSWKEDLLQRLRELGVGADAYLRKGASAATIVQHAAELLRARARIEKRLAVPGEVRGRLDGLTTATLLTLLARVKPDSRLAVRDGSFLYEIEMRGGEPRAATRTAADGTFERGSPVVTSLLGVRVGRFSVVPASGPVRGTLSGTLSEQLAVPVARARAAQRELTGARLARVRRIQIDIERMRGYLEATPEPMREIVRRLSEGASPQELLTANEIAPAWLEDLLADLASHGAVSAIWSVDGEERIAAALAEPPPRPSSLPAPSSSAYSEYVDAAPARAESPISASAPAPAEPTDEELGLAFDPPDATAAHGAPSSGGEAPYSTDATPSQALGLGDAFESIIGDRRPSAPEPSDVAAGSANASAGSSLEDAVIRQLFETPPSPVAALSPSGLAAETEESSIAPSPSPPPPIEQSPILDARALKTRTSLGTDPEASVSLASLPPDAVVPASDAEEAGAFDVESEVADAEAAAHEVEREPRIPIESDEKTFSGTHAQPSSPLSLSTADTQPPRSTVRRPPTERLPIPAAPARGAHRTTAQSRPVLPEILLLVALAAVGALAFRWIHALVDHTSASSSSNASAAKTMAAGLEQAQTSPPRAGTLPLTKPAASVVEAAAVSGASSAGPVSEDLPLPPEVTVRAGFGLLEMEGGEQGMWLVDGTSVGHGPLVRVVLAPGTHELRSSGTSDGAPRTVLVRAGRRTRVVLSSPWTP